MKTNNTIKTIQSFGQSLREMPVTPVLPSEEIVKYKNIVGVDGYTRSVILVEEMQTTGGFGGNNKNTFYGEGKTPRGNWQRFCNTMKSSYGLRNCRGIVTDGRWFRYVK
jgi:hypothetical protein